MDADELITDLYNALDDGDLITAGTLLDAGADPNCVHPLFSSSCLHAAWVGAGLDGVRLLAERGVDPSPILLWVALNDEPRQLTELIRLGADPDFADDGGWTALHRVAAYGYVASARALLESGAQRDVRTSTGLTAADLARTNHHLELTALLT